MAEIEITLPTVQYGNVKVRATPEELGLESVDDATSLGIATAVYLNLFTQGFRSGAQMDVSAALSASQGVTEAQAQRYLDEGLGGVTEVEEYDSATEAKEAAQARYDAAYSAPNDGPEPAPWDNPQVDAKPKPWENKSAAPAKPVVDEGW